MRYVLLLLALTLPTSIAHADLSAAETDAKRARLFSDELLLHLKGMKRRRVQKKRTERWLAELHGIRTSLSMVDAWIREQSERQERIASLKQEVRITLSHQLSVIGRKERALFFEHARWTVETARKRAELSKAAADHNARPPGEGASKAAVKKYNREADEGNARSEAFERRVEAEEEAFRKREYGLAEEKKALMARQEELQARRKILEAEYEARARMITVALREHHGRMEEIRRESWFIKPNARNRGAHGDKRSDEADDHARLVPMTDGLVRRLRVRATAELYGQKLRLESAYRETGDWVYLEAADRIPSFDDDVRPTERDATLRKWSSILRMRADQAVAAGGAVMRSIKRLRRKREVFKVTSYPWPVAVRN